MEFNFGSYGYIAKRNLKSAERNLGLDADLVIYSSQQAVEKMLKQYVQLHYFAEDAESVLHTHKLYILMRKSGIKELQEFKSVFDDLSRYYFDGRYPGLGYEEPTMEEAERLFHLAEEAVSLVEDKIEQSATFVQKSNLFGCGER